MKTKYYILLLAMIAGACAKPPLPASTWQAEQNWTYFDASGRLGVKVQEQGSYGHFDWLRQNGVETIDINTPIGTTLGSLCRDQEGVMAMDHKNRLFQAASLEDLSQQLLGYRLPLSALPVWANGEWVASEPHQLNEDGSLQQYGWRVQYQQDEQGKPYLLELKQNDLSVRLVFNRLERAQNPVFKAERCEWRPS